jgi:hypothetical protein
MAVDYYGKTVFDKADINTPANQTLGFVDQIGEQQNQFVQEQANRAKAARQAAIDLRLQQAKTAAVEKGTQDQKKMQQANTDAQTSMQPNSTSTGSGSFKSFKDAIAKQESGSTGYKAINALSGAMGKYQIMPSNLAGQKSGWDYQALGYDVSPAQFIASPEIQEKIADKFLQGYYNKYGPAGAAVAWYAGPNAANKYVAGQAAGTNGQAGGHPSVSSYIQSILDKMGL